MNMNKLLMRRRRSPTEHASHKLKSSLFTLQSLFLTLTFKILFYFDAVYLINFIEKGTIYIIEH